MPRILGWEPPPEEESPTRGIPLDVVVRALTHGFIPACAGIMFALALPAIVFRTVPVGEVVGLVAGETARLIVGYSVTMLVMRHWLYSDAWISGRPAVVIGLFSPIWLFIVGIALGGVSHLPVPLSVLAGAGLAVVMYFPWLRSPPEEPGT
jgi:hypothetical protein